MRFSAVPLSGRVAMASRACNTLHTPELAHHDSNTPLRYKAPHKRRLASQEDPSGAYLESKTNSGDRMYKISKEQGTDPALFFGAGLACCQLSVLAPSTVSTGSPPRDDQPRPAAERLGELSFRMGHLHVSVFLPSCMHKVTPE